MEKRNFAPALALALIAACTGSEPQRTPEVRNPDPLVALLDEARTAIQRCSRTTFGITDNAVESPATTAYDLENTCPGGTQIVTRSLAIDRAMTDCAANAVGAVDVGVAAGKIMAVSLIPPDLDFNEDPVIYRLQAVDTRPLDYSPRVSDDVRVFACR